MYANSNQLEPSLPTLSPNSSCSTSVLRFEVDFQCRTLRLFTFCLCLSYFGVRIIINRSTLFLFKSKDAHLIGHVRPFCILATRLVLEQENVVVTFIVGPDVLDKSRADVRQLLNESSMALQRTR